MNKGLTVAEVDALTGDDMFAWLNNPFMSSEMVAEKVCWWVERAMTARDADTGGRIRALADLYESNARVSQNAKVYRNIANDLRALVDAQESA